MNLFGFLKLKNIKEHKVEKLSIFETIKELEKIENILKNYEEFLDGYIIEETKIYNSNSIFVNLSKNTPYMIPESFFNDIFSKDYNVFILQDILKEKGYHILLKPKNKKILFDESYNNFKNNKVNIKVNDKLLNFIKRYLESLEFIEKAKKIKENNEKEIEKMVKTTINNLKSDYNIFKEELMFLGVFPKYIGMTYCEKSKKSFLSEEITINNSFRIQTKILDDKNIQQEFGLLYMILNNYLDSPSLLPKKVKKYLNIEIKNINSLLDIQKDKYFNRNKFLTSYIIGLYLKNNDTKDDLKIVYKIDNKEMLYELQNLLGNIPNLTYVYQY